MKRVLLATIGTAAGLVALLSFKTQSHPLATGAGGLPSAAASPGSAGISTSAPPDPSKPSSPSSRNSSAARSASYVGSAITTRYGIVQVKASVTGSHITNVSFVQLTAFDPHSQQINSQAAPILLNETLSAQSAHVDTVSGATYTSDGYVQSLQGALDRAGIR